MHQLTFTRKVSIAVLTAMFTSCLNIPNGNLGGTNNSAVHKKYLKNLNASLFVPENIQEVEAPNSYKFVRPKKESISTTSIHYNQNSEQVKQTLVSSLNQSYYKQWLNSGFSMNPLNLSID